MSTDMMIAKTLLARVFGHTRMSWYTARPAVLPMCLLAFGYAPLLVMRGRLLMDCPHLSAFPLAVMAGGILASKGARGLGILEPGSQSRTLVVVKLAMAVLVVAAFLATPWLGVAAAMTTLLAGAYRIGGARLLRAVLPAWGLVALAVLMPVRVEDWLIGRLQALVNTCAGPVLDALSVIHITEGNVIRITSRSLFVEQACSGTSSLFAAIGVTLFYVLWTGRNSGSSVALVVASFCWVVLANVVRVVVVVVAAARWEIDLASGWPHELLGLMIFAAVLGLILSTDRLFQFLRALTTIRLFWPGYYCDAHEDKAGKSLVAAHSPPTGFANVGQDWLAFYRIGAVSAVLGLVQVIWLWPLLVKAVLGYSGPLPPQSLVTALKFLNEVDLPEHLGMYLRQRFETKVRGSESSFGEFSHEWHYRSGTTSATVAVDFPFRGWHELTHCYQSLGWSLKDRVVRTGKAPGGAEPGAWVEVLLERLPGRRATLIFAIDDQRGNDLEPPPTRTMLDAGKSLDILRFARTRLGKLMDSGDPSITDDYQVQLLIATDAPLSPTQWSEARAIFAQVRREVRSRVASRIRPVAKGGTDER
jgi:exosortase